MFSGCENGKEQAGTWVYRRSYAMIFSETKSIELREGYYNFTEPNIFCYINFDLLSSSCWYNDTGEKKEIYDAMCEKYGDMTYNRKEFVRFGGEPSFQMYSFVSVDIVSNADYNEEHPAGSSLVDLFTYRAYSAKPFIDSGYIKYEYEADEWDGHNTYLLSHYPVQKKVSDLTPDDFILHTSHYMVRERSFAEFRFESLPTLSKVHTFTVTFTDERGDTFSASLEMTFD